MASTDMSEDERELFLGMLGHDLRSPLSVIKLCSELSRKSSSDTRLVEDLQHRIEKLWVRMGAMIEDLLDFSRTKHVGRLPLKRSTFDMKMVIDKLMDDIRIITPGVKLIMEISGDSVGCWDEGRVTQIMSNLILNAVRHGDSGKLIKILIYSKDEMCCVDVFNEGRRIPENFIPDIFHAYRRGPGAIKKGLGLGLYITKFLVDIHGGSISVQSNEAGTTFKVCLPLKPKDDKHEDDRRDTRQPQTSG